MDFSSKKSAANMMGLFGGGGGGGGGDDDEGGGGGCAGHGWRDALPFDFRDLGVPNAAAPRALADGGESAAGRCAHTNEQLYALFDPRNARLPYMYDSVRWTHCESEWAQGEAADRLPTALGVAVDG